jgi:DNA-binding beta-propeller fold protein YncE
MFCHHIRSSRLLAIMLTLPGLGFIAPSAPAKAEPLLQAADYAPAALRQYGIPGGYEVLAAPELGAVFAASVPVFADDAAGDVLMFDGRSLAPLRRTQLPHRPFALAMDHSRGWIFAGNTKNGSVTVIDAKGGNALRVIQLGKPDQNGKMEHTRMIEVDEAGSRIFVSGPTDEGIIWIADATTGAVLHRLDNVGKWAAGLAYDPAGRLYVGSGGPEEIAVLDAGTGKRLQSFATGDTPGNAADGATSAHFFVNLSLDPQGQRLFAVDSHSGQLYVWNCQTGAVLGRIPIGKGALDVVYSARRNEAYVSYYGIDEKERLGTGGLVVVDAATYTRRAELAIKPFPSNLSLDEAEQTLFLSVSEPSATDHPDHRTNSVGSIMRLDLATLERLR